MSERPVGDQWDAMLRTAIDDLADQAPAVPEPFDLPVLIVETDEEDPVMLMKNRQRRRTRVYTAVAAAAAAVVAIVSVVVATSGDDASDQELDIIDAPELNVDSLDAPAALIAAEAYAVDPSAARLRDLFESIGGLEALELTDIPGAFEIVTFDPTDPDRVLFSERDGHEPGPDSGNNQQENVLVSIADGAASATAFAPELAHDSVNFNRDGTVTMWSTDEESTVGGFVPRTAAVLDSAGTVLTGPTVAVDNDRWATDAGTVLAIVGVPGILAYADVGFLTSNGLASLGGDVLNSIQTSGAATGTSEADTGGWVHAVPGAFIVSPKDDGPTRVWASDTLEELDDHPLAARELARVAVNADATVAVGVTHDGALEVIDLETGVTEASFGSIDVGNVDIPIAVSDDAEIAVTSEQDGTVTVWHLASREAVVSFASDSAQHRDLYDSNSTRLTSAIAYDATRVARRTLPGPEGIVWTIIDTDIDTWTARACALAGRLLSAEEREDAGLPTGPGPCG